LGLFFSSFPLPSLFPFFFFFPLSYTPNFPFLLKSYLQSLFSSRSPFHRKLNFVPPSRDFFLRTLPFFRWGRPGATPQNPWRIAFFCLRDFSFLSPPFLFSAGFLAAAGCGSSITALGCLRSGECPFSPQAFFPSG